MKNMIIAFAAAICALAAGCKNYEKAASTKIQKNAYVLVVAVENGFAGKCVGSKKDYTKMMSKLKPYAKTQVGLLDKTATRKQVLQYLNAGAVNDLFIFYFSGHGISSASSTDKTEADGKDEYILAYDGAISDNEIWNAVSKSKGRVVLIFDCCHSQTMFKAPMTFSRQCQLMSATHSESGPVNMICWSGCEDSKVSYGTSSGGYLTRAICSSFSKTRTYDQVWAKAEKSSLLKSKKQAAQCTKMGKDFGATTKVFQ